MQLLIHAPSPSSSSLLSLAPCSISSSLVSTRNSSPISTLDCSQHKELHHLIQDKELFPSHTQHNNVLKFSQNIVLCKSIGTARPILVVFVTRRGHLRLIKRGMRRWIGISAFTSWYRHLDTLKLSLEVRIQQTDGQTAWNFQVTKSIGTHPLCAGV